MPDREELLDWLRQRALLIGCVVALGGWALAAWMDRPLNPPAGILAPDEPLQGAPGEKAPWRFKDFTFHSLGNFELKARILSRERYRFDPSAKLSPLDLALGWGPMSDSRVLKEIRISQSDRWYHWRVSEPPIPLDQISLHSANMHMIPKDARVKRILLDFREGQVIRLKGHLVRVEGDAGFRWNSSTTRGDTGDGSCEVIWVEDAR